MLVSIYEIKIPPGRREVRPQDARELADSISQVGLLNPITITSDNTLIAGNHRLEAAKLLGWTKIECTVRDVNGLLAELAEIDENFMRTNLSPIEFGDLLLRRKEIYEELHPETKATNAGGPFRGNQYGKEVGENFTATSKSFVDDTAEKLGVTPRTVRNRLQTAKNLTPAVKEIIKRSDSGISKTDALKLSRLEPKEQEEVVTKLATGEISTVNEYKPYSVGNKVYATFEESVADLKNPNKDCSYTPDMLLIGLDGLVDRFHRDFACYSDPECVAIFPQVSQEQLEFIKRIFYTMTSALDRLAEQIERSKQNDK